MWLWGKCLTLAAAVVVLNCGPVGAHDFWIEPSSFDPPEGTVVAVGLRVGQDFLGDHVPHQSSLIARFVVLQGDEEEEIGGADNFDPAGTFIRNGDGTAVIVYSGGGSYVELPADKFGAYLKQYGLESVVEERQRREEQADPGRERFYRYAKALIKGAQSSLLATKPVGLRYEIVARSDPTSAAGPFRGQILFDGQPLPGALVEVIPKIAPKKKLVVHTDVSGEFATPWECQEFRVRACIMGTKEITHGTTKRACYPG